MTEAVVSIQAYEDEIERALQTLEMPGELDKALAAYREVEEKLLTLDVSTEPAAKREQQRVLAYCLMRQGNVLRQRDEPQRALEMGEREMAAARASGDELTLARTLMSNGTNLVVSGEIQRGLFLLEEARSLFEKGQDYDSRQGLGWYWILQADLGNAGLLGEQAPDVVHAADRALEILLPLENWPGVARAYAARAHAHEGLGDSTAAAADRQAQAGYEERAATLDTDAA